MSSLIKLESAVHKGNVRDTFVNFKHSRKTAHTHNALDDAIAHTEALWQIQKELGFKDQPYLTWVTRQFSFRLIQKFQNVTIAIAIKFAR